MKDLNWRFHASDANLDSGQGSQLSLPLAAPSLGRPAPLSKEFSVIYPGWIPTGAHSGWQLACVKNAAEQLSFDALTVVFRGG